ncbi:MAG: late competence development ComFB family protein [Deltaproteobacteria bacterium]|nr:late competence development ComFB family protein [Deltaproteobacteria bacterium]
MKIPEPLVVNGYNLSTIQNRNKLRVVKRMREALQKAQGFCGCRICVEDLFAATMNAVPAHYAQEGSVILDPNPSDAELDHIIQQMIRRIAAHPTHT